MSDYPHATLAEMEAGLPEIRRAPTDDGVVRLIVRRPRADEREVLGTGELDLRDGLVGDNWKDRPGHPDRSKPPNPDTQLNIMSARVAALLAREDGRWALAGDQLYLDLDLSAENLPPGTRLALGDAVIEVTPEPHAGCAKFRARFGPDALKFVNSEDGRRLRLRGLCAKVVRPGTIRTGDPVRKIATD